MSHPCAPCLRTTLVWRTLGPRTLPIQYPPEYPSTAQADVTSHRNMNPTTLVTVAPAMNRAVSPGVMNPSPSVVSAKVSAPAPAATPAGGRVRNHSRMSFTTATA